MITSDQLLSAGYKPFTQRNLKQYTTQFYQKRFDSSVGKKYFITIAEYANKEYQDRIPELPDFSYAPDSQFEANGVTFNVEMLQPESIEQMEKFFEDIWLRMGCDYYERWNEC